MITATTEHRATLQALQSAPPTADPDTAEPYAADHILCLAWADWVQTRRFSAPHDWAAQLGAKPRPLREPRVAFSPGQPTAAAYGIDTDRLFSLHLAITSQPADDVRATFELHYRYQIDNCKAVAAEIGISRQAWYQRVKGFRLRVIMMAGRIEREKLAAAL